jgi:hypothetical protein
MADNQPAQGEPVNEKKFSLKKIEIQMLEVLQQQYFSTLSNFLSFIALERLAYTVTPKTQFKITDGTLAIWENPDEGDTPQGADGISVAPATGGGR